MPHAMRLLLYMQYLKPLRVQGSDLEQVLSRFEDAVLLLQGRPYMLAEKGDILQARRRRLPPSARVGPVNPCCKNVLHQHCWYSSVQS